MPIIKTHDSTLYSSNDQYNVVLKPLCDEHLPLLYKWCSDPEVLYWTEGDRDATPISYGKDIVHQIYGGVSQDALCFLVEVDDKPIGECWLQKMNLPDVIAMYDDTLDVRRIDMAIGEKDYWGKGIGSIFVGMLIEFAFCHENVDVLHCFSEDYNPRSMRMWEKNGFTLTQKDKLPEGQKGKWQLHYTLTKKDFKKPQISRYHT